MVAHLEKRIQLLELARLKGDPHAHGTALALAEVRTMLLEPAYHDSMETGADAAA